MFIQKYYPVAETIISQNTILSPKQLYRKHRRCDTTTALVREIPETLFVPAYAEDDNFIPERRKAGA